MPLTVSDEFCQLLFFFGKPMEIYFLKIKYNFRIYSLNVKIIHKNQYLKKKKTFLFDKVWLKKTIKHCPWPDIEMKLNKKCIANRVNPHKLSKKKKMFFF